MTTSVSLLSPFRYGMMLFIGWVVLCCGVGQAVNPGDMIPEAERAGAAAAAYGVDDSRIFTGQAWLDWLKRQLTHNPDFNTSTKDSELGQLWPHIATFYQEAAQQEHPRSYKALATFVKKLEADCHPEGLSLAELLLRLEVFMEIPKQYGKTVGYAHYKQRLDWFNRIPKPYKVKDSSVRWIKDSSGQWTVDESLILVALGRSAFMLPLIKDNGEGEVRLFNEGLGFNSNGTWHANFWVAFPYKKDNSFDAIRGAPPYEVTEHDIVHYNSQIYDDPSVPALVSPFFARLNELFQAALGEDQKYLHLILFMITHETTKPLSPALVYECVASDKTLLSVILTTSSFYQFSVRDSFSTLTCADGGEDFWERQMQSYLDMAASMGFQAPKFEVDQDKSDATRRSLFKKKSLWFVGECAQGLKLLNDLLSGNKADLDAALQQGHRLYDALNMQLDSPGSLDRASKRRRVAPFQ